MNQENLTLARPVAALAVMALLAGCASVPGEQGFATVSALARERVGQDARLLRNDADARALDTLIADKLRTPLMADDAVQIALLNNRALQSAYWNVGIAQADLVQAGRLKNPGFTFQRTRQGGAVDLERSLTVSLVSLLTAPIAQDIEGRRFAQTRLVVANELVGHAAKTRRAYVDALAAVQELAYARQVAVSAEAGLELTGRMAQAGNLSQLDLARQQSFEAEASAALVRAGQRAVATREQLTRLMGLWGAGTTYVLPDRLPDLPDLPAAPFDIDDIERIAIGERLDIEAARIEAAHTAAALGLTKTTRFINVLELAYVRNAGAGQSAAPGYAISLELPLFDWGGARVARSEAIYMQAVNKVAQVATDARSEARESYLDYRASYDLAKHYRDRVIPLRKKISDETMLRYNGMLISVFELLADAREQAAAVNSAIDALKQYWMAHANLEAALGGHLPAPPTHSTTATKGSAQ